MTGTLRRKTGTWTFVSLGDQRLRVAPRAAATAPAIEGVEETVYEVDTADLPDLFAVLSHAHGLPSWGALDEMRKDLRDVREYLRQMRLLPGLEPKEVDAQMAKVLRVLGVLKQIQEKIE